MKILVVDLETSSLIPEEAEVLEFGAARVDLGTGRIVPFHTLVRPDAPEERWAHCWFMNTARLRPADFATAPSLKDIAGVIQSFLTKYPVTAYNLAFDAAILRQHGFEIKDQWPCLMEICTPILRIDNGGSGWKWPAFREAWQYFFPEKAYRQSHRAGDDVLHESLLALELVRKGYIS